MGCASDKVVIGWLCALRVLEARKRFDSSVLRNEEGHISSGRNEGNISLLFFRRLHTVRRMSDAAQKGSRCVWEFKAREDGTVAVIDSLLRTITCSQSGFVPMILYHSKVSRESGQSQVAVR